MIKPDTLEQRRGRAGKRTPNSGCPLIVLNPRGVPCLTAGGAGGTMITTAMSQIMVNCIDRDWSLQPAISAPRLHNDGFVTRVDARVGRQSIDKLRELGHDVNVVSPSFGLPQFSRMNGITMTEDGGLRSGIESVIDSGAAGF